MSFGTTCSSLFLFRYILLTSLISVNFITDSSDSVIMEYLQLADLMKLYHRIGGLDVVTEWNWSVYMLSDLYTSVCDTYTHTQREREHNTNC